MRPPCHKNGFLGLTTLIRTGDAPAEVNLADARLHGADVLQSNRSRDAATREGVIRRHQLIALQGGVQSQESAAATAVRTRSPPLDRRTKCRRELHEGNVPKTVD